MTAIPNTKRRGAIYSPMRGSSSPWQSRGGSDGDEEDEEGPDPAREGGRR